MSLLDSIMQMFSQKQPQQQQPRMQVNKGATTKALSTRDEYMQYQMQMQEQGLTPLPYESWIEMKTQEMNRKK